MKSYTDIEQSKKLAKILPIESADMYYWCTDHYPKEDWIIEVGTPDDNYECVCAWSLAALLDVLPNEVGDNYYLTLDKQGKEYCCCYEDINGNSFKHEFATNAIDACYKMIELLHKRKFDLGYEEDNIMAKDVSFNSSI